MLGEPARRPLEGRLFAAGGRVCVLAMPLSTSLPIPLGIAAPAGIALLTWAFADLAADDATAPCALLVLAAEEDGRLAGPGTLTVATHYRDVSVAHPASVALTELRAGHRALLARAVLSAGLAEPLAALTSLFEEAGGILDAAADAPELVFEGPAACRLGGTVVPNHLLLHGVAGWALARVRSARLDVDEPPRAHLGLDPLWGSPDPAPDRAVALHAHGFTPLRIGAAR